MIDGVGFTPGELKYLLGLVYRDVKRLKRNRGNIDRKKHGDLKAGLTLVTENGLAKATALRDKLESLVQRGVE